MAMRLLTKVEFTKELQSRGLQQTEYQTDRTQVWEDKDGNQVFAPCDLTHYPDYILDEVLRAWKEVSHNGETFDERTFTIKKN